MATIIRFQFMRDERLRFLSHLDLQRLFQRSFRRGSIPTAFSEGFNPHIKLAFAGALPLGMITDCEYGDIVLTEDMPAEIFKAKMNAALPDGMKILNAEVIPAGTASLASSVKQADYTVTLFDQFDCADDAAITSAVEDLMTKPEIIIRKRNKKKRWVDTDIKPFVADLNYIGRNGDDLDFSLSIRYIDQKCVKAIQVMQALADTTGLPLNVDETLRLHKHEMVLEE